jgi:hypothetical protein
MTEQLHLRISTWKIFALGCVSAGFFLFCTIMSWRAGQGHVSPWFIPFILMSVPPILMKGPIMATPETLSLSTFAGRFEIRWDEIDRIEYGQSQMVFFAGEKRMGIPTPNWWSGPDRQLLHEAIHAAALKRNIEAQRTTRADYLFPKYTKIR